MCHETNKRHRPGCCRIGYVQGLWNCLCDGKQGGELVHQKRVAIAKAMPGMQEEKEGCKTV